MQYDFTTVMDRRGLDALAMDCPPQMPREGFDLIPMWVADMCFATVPAVTEAVIRRTEHPAFGYFAPREEYYRAIIDWHRRHNGVEGLCREHISYQNGVLGGVVSALNVMCSRGDSVLVHSPTYVGFTHALGDNGYHIVHSPLRLDENGVWRMDFADMEEKLREHKIHAAILCSPHNPCGRVWERWELEQAMELFRKYDVYVVSDEIWSDLTLNGSCHIPTQSVSADAAMRTAAMYAPSKTFNLAGLVGSYSVVYNPWLRDRMEKEASLCHYNSMNVLSMHALIGAYGPQGDRWLEELREVLWGNVSYVCDYFRENFPEIQVAVPQGTYMLFFDCTAWCRSHGVTIDQVQSRCYDVGVAIQDGRQFGGPCHLRMNVALPLSRVREAMERLRKYVFTNHP